MAKVFHKISQGRNRRIVLCAFAQSAATESRLLMIDDGLSCHDIRAGYTALPKRLPSNAGSCNRIDRRPQPFERFAPKSESADSSTFMSSGSEHPPEFQTASVEIELGGKKLRMQMSVNTGPARPANFLPLFRSVADSFVSAAIQSVEAAGGKVSCRNNCGACCRQAVPITEIEARRIRDFVNEMPEPRRSEIRERFAAAREKLEEAGLLPRLLGEEKITPEGRIPFILEYFRQGIPCPFLENESCSIYSERPIACREYLVITPAENCANLNPETVKCVKVRGDVTKAMERIGADDATGPRKWVPLILAGEWADAHPDETPKRPGMEVVHEFFNHLCDPIAPESGAEHAGMGL